MTYNDLISGLQLNSLGNESPSSEIPVEYDAPNDLLPLFDIDTFKQDLITSSAKKNKSFMETSERFNAYDVVHSCIRTPLFRLMGYPVTKYSDNWLPVRLRGEIGTACHNFLQDVSSSFTECEVYLRIPSIFMSVKIDALIGTATLVEIKTCSYADYAKILKTNQARIEDYYQALLYKYLLENFVIESRAQDIDTKKYNLPKFEKYNIKTIQMIYICHELFNSDTTLDKAVAESKILKQQLKSKYNYMWFIKALNYDLTTYDSSTHISVLQDKIIELNNYINEKRIPAMSHKYVDKKKCFFCLYSKTCAKIE